MSLIRRLGVRTDAGSPLPAASPLPEWGKGALRAMRSMRDALCKTHQKNEDGEWWHSPSSLFSCVSPLRAR